jgi:uncharacterized Zn finger protein (UPF0148 family)
MSRFNWGSLNSKTVERDSHNCPFCGRVLLDAITGDAKRYCSSCNEEFEVKKDGKENY